MEYKELTQEDVFHLLPTRKETGHKGDFGKVLLLCGSTGFTGAAALAAMGALRSGAGLVFLGVPEGIYPIEAVKLTEPVVFPVPDHNGTFSSAAEEMLISKLQDKDAVLIGPGIGRSQGAFSAVKTVLCNFHGPVVLDADGINMIGQHKDMVRGRTSPTILTPHEGEFLRLGGDLSRGREEAAVRMAKDLDGIILLKGHRTVITDGQSCYINPTGNPGMAVGGSGDVLSGIIASLLGQGLSPLLAAACGAWLHGAAGDICAREIGQYGMLPSDMLHVLPRLMK